MLTIPQRMSFLRSRPPPVYLFCRSRPPLRPGTIAGITTRNLSASSTSIKATLSDAGKDHKSIVVDGLAKLARAGFAGEGRVRLAMRGLEGQDAGVRVAVLGRSGSEGRLVAALLADPLSTEPEEERRWMEDILSWSSSLREGRGGAMLICYGPPSEIIVPPGSPISLLSVPSPLLRSTALEILLAPLPSSLEDLAVVTLQAAETPGARVIEYPVHKTLFWAGEGPDGLATLLGQKCTSTGPVLKVLSIPGLRIAAATERSDVKIIDLAIAEHAITQLRKSMANATTFEREWIQSGLETIRGWIISGSSVAATSGVKPAVKGLISSIIFEAQSLIQKEEESILATPKAFENRSTTSPVAADDIETLSWALKDWSYAAHSELKEGLDAAFTSELWKGLAWWKLTWAADDVTTNSRDVLAVGFLPESKKKLLFLAGRFSGAGYRGGGAPTSTPTSAEEELVEIRGLDKANELLKLQLPRNRYFGGLDYPPHIFRAANEIVNDVIPRLQASAARLLMQSFSVSATSILISIMLYLSEISVYSSSSVAALGIVYSARSLQNKWGKRKRWFKDVVTESGRIAIAETERWGWERLRESVKVGEHVTINREGLKRVAEGRKVVGNVRRALEQV